MADCIKQEKIINSEDTKMVGLGKLLSAGIILPRVNFSVLNASNNTPALSITPDKMKNLCAYFDAAQASGQSDSIPISLAMKNPIKNQEINNATT